MAFFQWRTARGSAIKMAQFKWLFLAMNGGTMLNIALNILPQSLGNDPLVGISAVLLFSYIIFIGIAVGIYRYKLFNIDKWWFRVWSWFFAGLIVVLLDIAFVSLLHLKKETATIISMLLVGWVYFPIRQRIWQHFSYSPTSTISKYIPEIITSVTAITNKEEVNNELLATLKRIFNTPTGKHIDTASPQPALHDSGLELHLPDIHNQGTFILNYAENGARLFNNEDIHLARGISGLYKQAYKSLESKKLGIRKERERIMGDLHDDLGPKLLSLIHKINKPSLVELARDSLRSLRHTVYSMQDEKEIPLSNLLANERPLLSERAAEKNLNITWNISTQLSATYLKPQEALHIKRILNELLSNELRHGNAGNLTISATDLKNNISIKYCSDSTKHNIDEWKTGVGIGNLSRRSKALNGTITWHIEKTNDTNTICCELLLPNNKGIEQ